MVNEFFFFFVFEYGIRIRTSSSRTHAFTNTCICTQTQFARESTHLIQPLYGCMLKIFGLYFRSPKIDVAISNRLCDLSQWLVVCVLRHIEFGKAKGKERRNKRYTTHFDHKMLKL